MLVQSKGGDRFWLTDSGRISPALSRTEVVNLALGASWEGETKESQMEDIQQLSPLTGEQIDSAITEHEDTTDLERFLAQVVYAVRGEKEPFCYGKATNTDVIGYVEDGRLVCEIYTFDCAGKAVFKAHYVPNYCNPFRPFWVVYRKAYPEAGFYDDWGWEDEGSVDDPGMDYYKGDGENVGN